MDEYENEQNQVYQLLPEARPLQNREAVQLKSFFQFTAASPLCKNIDDQPIQLIEIVPQDKDNNIIKIGTTLAQLFKSPIYQSYQQLYINEDNTKFATCYLNYGSSQSLKSIQFNNLDESCLIFQSRFQSGNLGIVSRSQQNPFSYNLALQRDTNSQATCQWYYFYVENRNNIGQFTFNIVNLVKKYSAYQNGMRPCVMSVQSGQTWKRDGYKISYKRNSMPYKNERNYYTLQFSYNFIHKNDKVYFAYSYPYTFTKLQNFLLQIQTNYPSLVQVKTLTYTLKENPVNIISITNPHSEDSQKKIKKDQIVICARVHPGETNSSFACQGFIKFLLENSEQSYNLRKYFIIKIIPFLNPDGVIHGNYRTSLSGNDLNRKWKKPDKKLHPEIWSIKKYLRETGYKKALFIDLHGHSKKKSSFMYGCLNKENPYLCKEFPFILSKKSHHFCYFNCNFSTPISREGTSRMNVWKQFGVDYSYTMQISFCGPIKSRQLFTIKDYIQMGFDLGKIISLYFCGKKYQSSQNNQISNMLKQFYEQQKLLELGTQQTSGSQSGQQQFNIQQNETKQETAVSSTKQVSRQLNGVLTKYLTQTKIKFNREYKLRNKFVKNEDRNSINIRIRKQLQPSRVSIRKIDLVQQINNPNLSFGFMKGNPRLTSRQIRNFDYVKNSYVPYSLSKGKLVTQKNQQNSLMLPKVLRQQQMKYRRYRKNESRIQISLVYEQNKNKHNQHSRASIYTNRQISLTQKILQSKQRHIQESNRYRARNS